MTYFSDAKAWTNMMAILIPEQTTLSIVVKPKYLPDGEDDKTCVSVGYKVGLTEIEIVSVFLWKNNNFVYSSCQGPDIGDADEIKSESETMTTNVSVDPITEIVLSSDGHAAELKGYCMGHYKYDQERQFWVQKNTVRMANSAELVRTNSILCSQDIFMYLSPNIGWSINDTPGKKGYWVKNNVKNKSLPQKGWKVYSHDKRAWLLDPTITIKESSKVSLCENITITVSGAELQQKFLQFFFSSWRG